MKKKETSTIAKVGQTVMFLVLTIASIFLIIGLWNFFDKARAFDSRMGRKFILFIFLIPLGLLYGAFVPWIKFAGFKGEVTGAQLMSIDEEGCYLGPIADFSLDDAKSLVHIFERESDWRYERFHYSDYAIYIKNTKGGHWFFPDKIDKCLIMTGEPASVMGMGFRIKEEEWAIIERILKRYQDNV